MLAFMHISIRLLANKIILFAKKNYTFLQLKNNWLKYIIIIFKYHIDSKKIPNLSLTYGTTNIHVRTFICKLMESNEEI